jgi:hypothetical protein
MPAFLYFVPGVQPTTRREDLRRFGLDYALERCVAVGQVTAGPDGQPGIVLADGNRVAAGSVRYDSAKQDWAAVPASRRPAGAPAVWVGLDRAAENRPGPEDLARSRMLPGHQVELADERLWLVPVARACAADEDGTVRGFAVALPRGVGLDSDGRWTAGSVLPRYRRLWELAEEWWAAFTGGKISAQDHTIQTDFSDASAFDCAVECLQANYRVGPVEISLLGLLDDGDALRRILDALVDWPVWLAAQKKMIGSPVPGDSPGPDGPPDSIPATGPPSPTSGSSPNPESSCQLPVVSCQSDN